MGKKVTFTLPAEIVGEATGAVLLGEFNNWDYSNGISLKKQKDGSMKVTTTLEGGRSYQYRYLLNDGRWVNDQRADDYVHVSGFQVDNCVVEVPADEKNGELGETVSTRQRKSAGGQKQKALKSKKAADDLTVIDGITKKASAVLAGEGITTLKALAKTSVKKLKGILETAGNKSDPSGWPAHAKAIVEGKMSDKAE